MPAVKSPRQFIKVAIGIFGLLVLAISVFGGTQMLTFWPLDGPQDFLQRITPLVVITVFMERSLEVFITTWRGKGEKTMKMDVARANDEQKMALAQEALFYKSETQQIALLAGLTFGVIVSAAGVRALSLFFYSDQIEQLAGWQKPVFAAVDILITAAVVGGGADGMHKIVKVFTSFFDTMSARLEAKAPASVEER